jgi:TolB protein
VTHDTTNNYDPVWRPDGLGVTFVSARYDAGSIRYDLYFANADGTVREPAAVGVLDSMSEPFWFPVGSTFGYLGIGQHSDVSVFVCAITPGLTSCTGISFGTSHTADHVTYPAWSADGSTLAFVSNAEGRKNIYILKTRDDNSPKRLTNSLTGEGAFTPAWSPDGAEIVFAADWTGNSEIYVMKADGTGVRQLTTSSGSGVPVCSISK